LLYRQVGEIFNSPLRLIADITQLVGKSTAPCGYRRSPFKGGKPLKSKAVAF
jgi:hypothetical protein